LTGYQNKMIAKVVGLWIPQKADLYIGVLSLVKHVQYVDRFEEV